MTRPGKNTWVLARWYGGPGTISLNEIPEYQCEQVGAALYDTFHNACLYNYT